MKIKASVGRAGRDVKTLVDLLLWRADAEPDRLGFSFYTDGEKPGSALTWRQLDVKAREIASRVARGGDPGRRALLIYPRWEQFVPAFFGCLYAGCVPIPAPAPHPALLKRAAPRLRAVGEDSSASLLLTTVSLAREFAALGASTLPAAVVLATDALDGAESSGFRPHRAKSEDLLCVQYTSGSTHSPRGVMISHGNFLKNSRYLTEFLESAPDRSLVTWLPHYHDMGLVSALHCLDAGMPVRAMNPVDFLKHPGRWLRAVSHTEGRVISGAPNFAYDLCAKSVEESELAGLDLSRWSLAWNSAEPVRSDTLQDFARRFKPCGFRPEALRPCYGLAEATLIVSGAPPATRMQIGGRSLVGSGRVFAGEKVRVVSPRTRRVCAPGRVGEIWVSGPSVAQGYWGNARQTRAVFRARTADGDGPFLRTGDLGFFRGPELFITGRLKDMIVLRGRKYYPEDVELAAEAAHPAVRRGGCAAFGIEVGGVEKLAVVVELDRAAVNGGAGTASDVPAAVRRSVAERCDVELYAAVAVRRGDLPRTTSGKIRRRECRRLFLAGAFSAPKAAAP
ncbi:MAG: fatty acyl-AMP ligase [Elusimicrobia bacterium]|nr:fatty acyl-AMP ligase [Elusimicrobiota bacterium]